MTIDIKQATITDAKVLSNIAELTFALAGPENADKQEMADYISEYLNESVFQDLISNDNIFVGCAQIDSDIAGFFVLRFDSKQPNTEQTDNAAELQRLYVLPEYHGSNVAKSLVSAAFSACEKNKTKVIWLCVFSENQRAKKFYAKNGFQEAGSIDFKMGSEIHLDTVMVADVDNRQQSLKI